MNILYIIYSDLSLLKYLATLDLVEIKRKRKCKYREIVSIITVLCVSVLCVL